ncbi:hypothetical protein PM8797T_15266 [Gimesia maris DSM 8797]|nr:hypothetical protein PM8797T_15266 [Gimesia maris DSM 8797]
MLGLKHIQNTIHVKVYFVGRLHGGERKLITFLVRELAADDAVGEAGQDWRQSAGAQLVQILSTGGSGSVTKIVYSDS